MERGNAEGSWLQEQNELLAVGPKEQAKLVKEVMGEDIDYKHSRRTMQAVESKEAKGGKR